MQHPSLSKFALSKADGLGAFRSFLEDGMLLMPPVCDWDLEVENVVDRHMDLRWWMLWWSRHVRWLLDWKVESWDGGGGDNCIVRV